MSSINVIVVDKSGTIKETSIKGYKEEELYKKAGFKSADDFKLRTQWVIESLNGRSYSIHVYGKISGRANQENKYDFPPPIDNTLMFGNVLIVNKDRNDKPVSISSKEWEAIYEYLFGGFEELGDKDGDEDEDDEIEDDDDDEDGPRTKDGYLKDGFIVDDEDEDDDYEDEDEEEEEDMDEDEEDIKPKTKKSATVSTKSAKTSAKTSKKKKSEEELFTKVNQENVYLDCTSELSEEEYV